MTTQTTQTQSGGDSFAALFEQSLTQSDFGKEGEVTKGTVVAIQGRNVVVDVGGKSEGVLPADDFRDAQGNITVKPGDVVDVFIVARENDDGLVTLSKEWADRKRVWEELVIAKNDKLPIEGTIMGRIKGGLTVRIRGGIEAFLPGSQVDLRPVRNLEKLIGQTLQFEISKLDNKRRNIVVSRRDLLQKERDSIKTKTLEKLKEGDIVKGVIKNITEYGAFVDLGGIDGLLHITDMSWGRVNHPSELLQVGDERTVKVLKYNAETERVSLGLKQMQDDPWSRAEGAYVVGKKVTGKVMSIAEYGAFVELEPGIEGLIHVSDMSWTKKIKNASKVLEIGTEVECQVLEVDSSLKRIKLGMKQLEADPWTLFIEKYRPGQVVGGKVRSITDYGVFVGIEDGVDGMVHKSDISWSAKVNNPADLVEKGADVKAIILVINHDEKKVSLGIKQLFDDPWPTIFADLPTGTVADCTIMTVTDHGLYVKVKDGVEGHIPTSEMIAKEGDAPYVPGEVVKAEMANIDAQERRITLSMKVGEVSAAIKGEKRASIAPKKVGGDPNQASTLGELIKQKLGKDLLDKKEE